MWRFCTLDIIVDSFYDFIYAYPAVDCVFSEIFSIFAWVLRQLNLIQK